MMIMRILKFLFPIVLLLVGGFLLYWLWGSSEKVETKKTEPSLLERFEAKTLPFVKESTIPKKEPEAPVLEETSSTLSVQGIPFRVEVVSTPEARSNGLQYREYLESDAGMLFVFEKSDIYDFWMPNLNFPLDIVWIAEDLSVVDIKTVPPCTEPIMQNCPAYTPDGKAKYVLEVNADMFPGIIGDEVVIEVK